MPKDSLIGKTPAELNNELIKFKKESMNLRFQKSMGQLEKPSRIKVVRKEIARIKTILNKKENDA
tara:strand:- start:15 stop:209 length:195 start_codon:yes stop_codon:yes gene_type:complete